METQTHTLGQVGVDGTRVYHAETGETIALTIQGVPSHRINQANAERLALAWNCHDDLLTALERIVSRLGDYNPPQDIEIAAICRDAIAKVRT